MGRLLTLDEVVEEKDVLLLDVSGNSLFGHECRVERDLKKRVRRYNDCSDFVQYVITNRRNGGEFRMSALVFGEFCDSICEPYFVRTGKRKKQQRKKELFESIERYAALCKYLCLVMGETGGVVTFDKSDTSLKIKRQLKIDSLGEVFGLSEPDKDFLFVGFDLALKGNDVGFLSNDRGILNTWYEFAQNIPHSGSSFYVRRNFPYVEDVSDGNVVHLR